MNVIPRHPAKTMVVMNSDAKRTGLHSQKKELRRLCRKTARRGAATFGAQAIPRL